MKKQEILQQVENSVSSIFSKQDVLDLINKINENPSTHGDPLLVSISQLEKIKSVVFEEVSKAILNLDSSQIPVYNFEFDLYSNTISVNDYEVDTEEINANVLKTLDDVLDYELVHECGILICEKEEKKP